MRSQMKAQLKEQIESDKQELAALDALELDVSEEQDEESEGVKEVASWKPEWETPTCPMLTYDRSTEKVSFSYMICPPHMCCENNGCFHKRRTGSVSIIVHLNAE